MLTPPARDAAHLRDALERAVEKHNRAAAADALRELTTLEADQPRWPHRLGETLSRLGRAREAEQAYVQAARGYAAQGFLARAIAVAKLAVDLNPARVDLLEDLDVEPAQSLRRVNRAAPAAAAGSATSDTAAAHPLEPQAGAGEDEVRFEDAPASCTLEVQLVDFDVSVLADEDLEEAAPSVAKVDDAALDAQRLSRMSGAALFADVPRGALAEIAQGAERVTFDDREMIFRLGDPSDALLVIVEGSADVRLVGRPLVEVREGDVLGETVILEGAVRTADVRARAGCVALRIRKAALDAIIARHPSVGEVLFGLLARRLVSDGLETSSLFAPFDPTVRAEIARAFEVRRARAGTVLQETGKKGDGLYLVLSGVAEAREGSAVERLSHGALIGHETLVTRAAATRTVTVVSEAVLLRLPAARFAAFVTEYPPALAHLAELAAGG